MGNVVKFPGRPHVVTDRHRRIADKIVDIVKSEIPDAENIRVESIETVCVCGWRDLIGKSICLQCPENPNRSPDGDA